MEFKWSTIGHDSVKQYFEKLIANGIFRSHAFFFVGPQHIGKTTLVAELISMMFCGNTDHKPCGKCVHCTHLQKKIHPDVFSITHEEGAKNIKVEEVRNVLEQLQSGALFHSKKMCVVGEAELLSAGAANALLKTLEEPTKDTFFFFITSQEEALPFTIRSRCQMVRMYPLSRSAVRRFLESKGKNPTESEELTKYSQGRLGLIWNFLDEESAWEKEKTERVLNMQSLLAPGYKKSPWYEKPALFPLSSTVQYAHEILLYSLSLQHQRAFPWISTISSRGWRQARELLTACVEAVKFEDANVNVKMLIDGIHKVTRNVV